MHAENKMIPLFYPPNQNVNRMIRELRETLSGRWWGQGPKVDEFEKRFSVKFGFERSLMTSSGTSALHLAYILAGVKRGDEVVVPVLTCTATCHPLLWMGARIIFCDIFPSTLTQNYYDLEEKITKKTKAIVLVHLGGFVDELALRMVHRIRRRTGVAVIEDAAQALGAKMVGAADFTVFSFQAIKSLSTGDGGMLICKRKIDHDRAKRLRWFSIDRETKAKKSWQAWDRRGITFDQIEPGYKYQPTDIDASIGLAALEDFDENISRRSWLAKIYRNELRECTSIQMLDTDRTLNNSNWLFMVMVDDRNAFARRLLKAGIETNVAHIRNDVFTVFGGRRQKLPGMDSVEKKYLCLPLNDRISDKDVLRVCRAIKGANG